MASSKEYLDFVLEQLSELDDISYKAMMGEYIIYYRGKIVGGVYDDRFLVKPVKTAKNMMPEAELELPYEGAKAMLLVDNIENKEFLKELLEGMYSELPDPKKKKLKMIEEKIIAACGNDCAACPRYTAYPYEKTEEELHHTAELWMKTGYRDHIVTNEEISCTGCKPENWCRYRIIKCCVDRGIKTCGECAEYPCDNIKECFAVTKTFEPMCRQVCTDDEYKRLEKAFFEKEKNLIGKMVKLVPVQKKDIELLWRMQVEAFTDLLDKYQDFDLSPAVESIDKVIARFEQPWTKYYFIIAGGIKVGAVRVVDKQDGSRKRISPIWIMPKYRNKGYAQQAILAAEKIYGSDHWCLDTILQEEGNLHLYEKLGYHQTGQVDKINERMDIVYYEKD